MSWLPKIKWDILALVTRPSGESIYVEHQHEAETKQEGFKWAEKWALDNACEVIDVDVVPVDGKPCTYKALPVPPEKEDRVLFELEFFTKYTSTPTIEAMGKEVA